MIPLDKVSMPVTPLSKSINQLQILQTCLQMNWKSRSSRTKSVRYILTDQRWPLKQNFDKIPTSPRSSRQEVFCKKGVLRNFSKITRKHLRQSLFFNKVAGLRHRCFPVNFAKFLRTPFFTEHRWLLLITAQAERSLICSFD